ncbi:ATP:cob(I)alamin adenosyltransferase, partial [Chromobacterium phragmitis]|nr:ATP:cob(I)alamin adenosyltransferase [Chromobacterium amazonense]
RAICRRAERSIVALAREEVLSQPLRRYLNRLSDFLFVLARYLNREGGVPDVLWKPGRER